MNYFQNFYEIYNKITFGKGALGLVMYATHNIKATYSNIRIKLNNLSKTNLELALFHFDNHNLNDAIFRFKILHFFAPNYCNIYYYIGRAYLEKFNYTKCQLYLELYLKDFSIDDTNLTNHVQDNNKDIRDYQDLQDIQDLKDLKCCNYSFDAGEILLNNRIPIYHLPKTNFVQNLEEAVYSLNIARHNIDNINKIPFSLLERKFDALSIHYNALYINNKKFTPQIQLMQMLQSAVQNSSKPFHNTILDLGCGTGIMGMNCKTLNFANVIIGVDISIKMCEIASTLRLHEAIVYDSVIKSDLLHYLNITNDNSIRYDIIILSDIITYCTDIKHIFTSSYTISSDNAFLCVIFRIHEVEMADSIPQNISVENIHNQFIDYNVQNNTQNKICDDINIKFCDKTEMFAYNKHYIRFVAESCGWFVLEMEICTFSDGGFLKGLCLVFFKKSSNMLH